jgi:hypothetical protein
MSDGTLSRKSSTCLGLIPLNRSDSSMQRTSAGLYQGLVPKLLFRQSSGELSTLRAAGLAAGAADQVLLLVALVEIVFGASFLLLWRVRALFLINAVALIVLGIGAVRASPGR